MMGCSSNNNTLEKVYKCGHALSERNEHTSIVALRSFQEQNDNKQGNYPPPKYKHFTSTNTNKQPKQSKPNDCLTLKEEFCVINWERYTNKTEEKQKRGKPQTKASTSVTSVTKQSINQQINQINQPTNNQQIIFNAMKMESIGGLTIGKGKEVWSVSFDFKGWKVQKLKVWKVERLNSWKVQKSKKETFEREWFTEKEVNSIKIEMTSFSLHHGTICDKK